MHVMIGVPSARGAISSNTVSTIVTLCDILGNMKVQYQFTCVSHADVTVARNTLAAAFLSGPYDVFIGIDDDVGISKELLIKLVSLQYNFLGVYLPQRSLDLSRFEQAVLAGHRGRAAQYVAAPYVPPSPHESADALLKGGIRKVERIGTGFYIMRRNILEAMIKNDIVVREVVNQANFTGVQYGFFNNISSNEGYLSEDYSFCERIRQAGFDIPRICWAGCLPYRQHDLS